MNRIPAALSVWIGPEAASIVLIKANKKTTRKGGFLIGKVGFEPFNVTVRRTVTREGLTERNNDLSKAEMKRIPAAP